MQVKPNVINLSKGYTCVCVENFPLLYLKQGEKYPEIWLYNNDENIIINYEVKEIINIRTGEKQCQTQT